ncbi:unnamed protein product [Rotaria sp. Silwood1]|nr:unnamed protein product [Rotaria sp. Silwood1]CAF1264399.1 unnamed protein product [Rotaria sp. Silwood1]CAF4626010.1 unnamed protein product [Rotaria sp. Silwood1]
MYVDVIFDASRFAPGDYILINVPCIALYEFHPFTISTAPEEQNYLRVHIQAKGNWTQLLYKYFKDMSDKFGDNASVKIYRADLNAIKANVEERIEAIASTEDSTGVFNINTTTSSQSESSKQSSKTVIVINGPYSSCARYIFDCKHVVLIGSGIGITPYASILFSLMARFRTLRTVCKDCQGVTYHGKHRLENHHLQKVDFIWVTNDIKSWEWFLNLLHQFEVEQDEYLASNRDERRFLDIHLYFTGKSQGCFASNTTVRLANGDLKQMSDLHVGDLVFVKKENEIITSPVLAIFRHYRSSIHFVDIYTTNSIIPLRLTPLHSLLVLSKHDKHERYIFAKDVSVGNHVFSSDLRPLAVVNVKETLISDDSGYAILTFEGNIIANDIVASCYATYDHSTMHMITTPMRWWFLILFQLRQFIAFDYLQHLTSNIIVSFVDFYLQSIY